MSKREDAFHDKMDVAIQHCECDRCEARRGAQRKLIADLAAERERARAAESMTEITKANWRADLDKLEAAERERDALRARVAELEKTLDQQCSEYCRWYDTGQPAGYDGSGMAYRLTTLARQALAPATVEQVCSVCMQPETSPEHDLANRGHAYAHNYKPAPPEQADTIRHVTVKGVREGSTMAYSIPAGATAGMAPGGTLVLHPEEEQADDAPRCGCGKPLHERCGWADDACCKICGSGDIGLEGQEYCRKCGTPSHLLVDTMPRDIK